MDEAVSALDQLLPLIEAALAVADEHGLDLIAIHLDAARVLAAELGEQGPSSANGRN
jgi:hypothetical protein